jgi:hypothetical protein
LHHLLDVISKKGIGLLTALEDSPDHLDASSLAPWADVTLENG